MTLRWSPLTRLDKTRNDATEGRNDETARHDCHALWHLRSVKHWHGATDKNGVSHIAVSNVKGGKAVDWMEKATDAQYLD